MNDYLTWIYKKCLWTKAIEDGLSKQYDLVFYWKDGGKYKIKRGSEPTDWKLLALLERIPFPAFIKSVEKISVIKNPNASDSIILSPSTFLEPSQRESLIEDINENNTIIFELTIFDLLIHDWAQFCGPLKKIIKNSQEPALKDKACEALIKLYRRHFSSGDYNTKALVDSRPLEIIREAIIKDDPSLKFGWFKIWNFEVVERKSWGFAESIINFFGERNHWSDQFKTWLYLAIKSNIMVNPKLGQFNEQSSGSGGLGRHPRLGLRERDEKTK